MGMIYSCFTYNGEKELLRLRIEELRGLNVTHVLVESDHTFSGKKRTVCGPPDWLELRSKGLSESVLKFICVTDMPNNGDAWSNERWQRDAIMRGLIDAQDDDIIIISDCDEIVKRETVEMYRLDMGLTAVKCDTYRYYLNCLEDYQNWIMPKIMPYSYLKTTTPDKARNSGYPYCIDNGGWHFSYLGGVERIKEKIFAFSHQELNTPEFLAEIERKHAECESLFSPDIWPTVPVDDKLPEFVRREQNGFFKAFIKR